MTRLDQGFLLLTSHLGDPTRKPLTVAQLRELVNRIDLLDDEQKEEELTPRHLIRMGYERPMAEHIVELLEEELRLLHYEERAEKCGCIPVTRAGEDYPNALRRRLGKDSPGCLWLKGDPEILLRPRIALVGSRDLREPNLEFAREAGRQAAQQGIVLVSGNARGADREAQRACLDSGGQVISVVADSLAEHTRKDNVLYLSEEDFDAPFTAQRALLRNRVIHALGSITLAAQCTFRKGGTWDGSTRNLRHRWSPLFCFRDGSEASIELEQMGAGLIDLEDLSDFSALEQDQICFLYEM